MPLVGRRRITLALEHMTQMPSTVVAHNLNPLHTKRAILISANGARDCIEERGPSTTGLEFVAGFVQRRLTSCTCVQAGGRGVLVILAHIGRLGTLLAKDAELLC